MPKQYDFDIEGHKIAALGCNEQLPGTPAIFIHGITSTIHFWTVGQIPLFAEKHRWYSLSLPGHYPAAFPRNFQGEELTPELIARVLRKAIRHLVGEQRVILVGYSTGAFAALAIAAQFPEMVERLICIAGFAQGRWTGALGMSQWMVRRGGWLGRAYYKSSYFMLGKSESLLRMGMNVYLADRRAAYANPGYRQMTALSFPHLSKLDHNAMILWFQKMPEADIRNLLPSVTAPTLVMAGTKDPIVPPSQARLIADAVPQSQLVMLDGAGHMPMLERSQVYCDVVTGWMTA